MQHTKCAGDHNHADKRNGKTDNGEDEIYAVVVKCRGVCIVDQEKGVTFTRDMIVVGGRQTWPDVTLTMILSDA